MKIGFTGTQVGMTDPQHQWVWHFICRQQINLQVRGESDEIWGLHGDCIGADHDFHRIVRRLNGKIHLFPPIDNHKRAFCDYDIIEPEAEYLVRDHDIVDACELMLATPSGDTEILRSGTWATIRYARKSKRTMWVINPDGSVNAEWTQIPHD